MATPIPSQAEYERRELDEAQRRIREVEKAPLADRKEAAEEFFEAMSERPEIVGERIGWLFGGSYGYGEMMMARQIADNTRMNREAALVQLVGIFEWMSPQDRTRASWKKLTDAEKDRLDEAVKKAIEDYEEEDD